MAHLELVFLILGGALSLLGIVTIVQGGRRWKGEYEAEHVKAERLEATLVEKDQIISGMSDRLKRLDETVQELGGRRVFEAIMSQNAEASERYAAAMTEFGGLFSKLFEKVDATERRAQERHVEVQEQGRQLVGLIGTLGHSLVELINGKE